MRATQTDTGQRQTLKRQPFEVSTFDTLGDPHSRAAT
jgi:hypothetical protein